jgi:hypothetical protein
MKARINFSPAHPTALKHPSQAQGGPEWQYYFPIQLGDLPFPSEVHHAGNTWWSADGFTITFSRFYCASHSLYIDFKLTPYCPCQTVYFSNYL